MTPTPRGQRLAVILALSLTAITVWHWNTARALSPHPREVVVLQGPNGTTQTIDKSLADRANGEWLHRSDAATPIARHLSPRASRTYARTRMTVYGWSHAEFTCLDALWTSESNWRTAAYNRTPVSTPNGPKHAGGIPQILGLDPATPTATQIHLGLEYIKARYSSPCTAWNHWQWKHWY